MIPVMIVDDERYERKGIIAGTDWALIGCEVVAEAADGEEGIRQADEKHPWLVISDIRMPRKDGLEMARELLERYPDMKVIFLTAHDEFEYAREAIRIGVSDYLLKPFEDGELEAAIQRLLHMAPEGTADRAASEDELFPLPGADSTNNRYIQAAVSYIEDNYGDNSLSIGRIAEALGVSDGHLSRLFKSELDISINNYITRFRIRRAMDLLKDVQVKVYEVAEQVGYLDIAYFSNTFKKLTGISPSDYQTNGLSHLYTA